MKFLSFLWRVSLRRSLHRCAHRARIGPRTIAMIVTIPSHVVDDRPSHKPGAVRVIGGGGAAGGCIVEVYTLAEL